jgi:hypothetical protein
MVSLLVAMSTDCRGIRSIGDTIDAFLGGKSKTIKLIILFQQVIVPVPPASERL